MTPPESHSQGSRTQPEASDDSGPPGAVPPTAASSAPNRDSVPSEPEPAPPSGDNDSSTADSDDLDAQGIIGGWEPERQATLIEADDTRDSESVDQSFGDDVEDPPETPLTAQSETLSQLLELTLQVKGEITNFHGRSEFQEDIVRRMQTQIEDLRADQIRSLLKPVVVSLAELHAHVIQLHSSYSLDPERIYKEIGLFAHRVEEAIEHLGFDSLDVTAGDRFEAELHTAERTRPTNDPAQDRCIASVRRQGFGAPEDTKPILYARVTIHQYEAAPFNEPDVPDPEIIPKKPDDITLLDHSIPPRTEELHE